MEKDQIRLKKKGHKILKGVGIALCVLLLIAAGAYVYITTHPQAIIGLIQKGMYGDSSPNSFEPLYTPGEGTTANGQYKINDIAYGTEYPNSFLDITYPDSDTEVSRPTLFYFHGGGFFGGSKNMGDPMAASEATALIDDLCAQGYNIVNVDYALVPDCHFPVPLIQMNEAIHFIEKHKDEYHINMDNIILMGSSAGAIMTAQYGTIITNPEYAALLEIEPALRPEQVSAVVIDDGPIDYRHMALACKLLVGNYVKGSIYLNEDELDRYECIPHMTSDYPAAFLLGSEYRIDMIAMGEKLQEVGAKYILIDPLAEHGEEKPHCFVAAERADPIAKEAFDRLTAFLKERTS
ncbi:MAG: alpha/beta hydrolase [Oscillospiraceae bacterium]|nr:alpha/beta hydrolase [Oscillospiraceae bacterium]